MSIYRLYSRVPLVRNIGMAGQAAIAELTTGTLMTCAERSPS